MFDRLCFSGFWLRLRFVIIFSITVLVVHRSSVTLPTFLWLVDSHSASLLPTIPSCSYFLNNSPTHIQTSSIVFLFWDEPTSTSLRGTWGCCHADVFFNVVMSWMKISSCGVSVISLWCLCFSRCGVQWNEIICGAGVSCFTFLKSKFNLQTLLIHAHLWQTQTIDFKVPLRRNLTFLFPTFFLTE